MGGGGGGNDYQAQQASIDAKKQQARDALNLQFGLAPDAPDAASYWHKNEDSDWGMNLANGGIISKRSWGLDPLAEGNALGGGEYRPIGDQGTSVSFNPGDGWQFDQGGYDKAVADYNTAKSTAATNKTARDSLYSDVRTNAYDAGKRGLDEAQQKAKRANKFELFAKGLAGGSEDIDQNALLDRTYNQGLLDLGTKADTVRNSMKSSDEGTRLNLLQSIDAGMDQSSALSSAVAQMQNANDKAGAEAAGTALGDIFSGTGLLYEDSQARKGKSKAASDFYSMFSTAPRSSTAGASGTITSTR